MRLLEWYKRFRGRGMGPLVSSVSAVVNVTEPCPKPWAPGEPAQSILRTLKRQRHRFLFTHTRRYARNYRWSDNWYSACDTETGRVLFLHNHRSRYCEPLTAASTGLSPEEAQWIHDQYREHIQAVKARATRIAGLRVRKQLLSEYVK